MNQFNAEEVSSPLWFNKDAEEIVAPLLPRIVSIQTQRAAQMPVPEDDPQDSDPEFVINVLYGIGGDYPHIMLVSDLFVVSEGTLAGVSMSCSISISSSDLMNDTSAEAIGYWATHVLYDITVSKWKELTSASSAFSSTSFPEAPDALEVKRFNVNEKESS